jgi:hypothetical protein
VPDEAAPRCVYVAELRGCVEFGFGFLQFPFQALAFVHAGDRSTADARICKRVGRACSKLKTKGTAQDAPTTGPYKGWELAR